MEPRRLESHIWKAHKAFMGILSVKGPQFKWKGSEIELKKKKKSCVSQLSRGRRQLRKLLSCKPRQFLQIKTFRRPKSPKGRVKIHGEHQTPKKNTPKEKLGIFYWESTSMEQNQPLIKKHSLAPQSEDLTSLWDFEIAWINANYLPCVLSFFEQKSQL